MDNPFLSLNRTRRRMSQAMVFHWTSLFWLLFLRLNRASPNHFFQVELADSFHWDTPLLAAVGRKREINAGNV
jgi:hypothetical protein